ncbi:MAG TPA: F0F1 ATP synthase subunit B, partial [Steroidobacteraceae bacterium]|nr:F0F1 ATP synthase subunit B [Steroidobacteraceae bacterium]
NINLTLIIQMIVFALVVWFTMSKIWPSLMTTIEERQRKIAQGLAAADKGEAELAQAREGAEAILREARERGGKIIEQAQHRANDILEQARTAATQEGQRLVASAQQQIGLETSRARESLRREVGEIAVAAASKLLEREIDARTHQELISKLAAQI